MWVYYNSSYLKSCVLLKKRSIHKLSAMYFLYIVNIAACITSLISMSIAMKTVRRMQCLHSVSTPSISTGKGVVDFSPTETSPPIIPMNKSEKLLSWGVNLTEEAMVKTGAEMRKSRKSLKSQTSKSPKLASKKKVKTLKSSTETAQTRFHLGNGMDAISVQNLLDLVKSTAPYVFPEFAIRQIIEEDDDGEDDDDDNDDLDSDLKLSSKQRNIPIPIENVLNPSGWKNIILASKPSEPPATPTASERIHYFSLCMASHFATVATFVPTDVDSKIRGHCWFDPDPEVIAAQYELVKAFQQWDVSSVSRRTLKVPFLDSKKVPSQRLLSGHDGEWLGTMMGAWGACLRTGDNSRAAEAEELITAELQREAMAFKYLRSLPSSTAVDTMMLKLAAVMTHNVGDVDQGISYWLADDHALSNSSESLDPAKLKLHPAFGASAVEKYVKFSKLAHERYDRFGGEFGRAKLLYKHLVSAEGHRNYPLREAKCLRKSPDLMLPFAPWLEDWGRTIATHPELSTEDRINIVKQLVRGCDGDKKPWGIPNQVGYFRALYGIQNAMNLDDLTRHLDRESRWVLKQHSSRLHLSISDSDFASKLGKRARELLATN